MLEAKMNQSFDQPIKIISKEQNNSNKTKNLKIALKKNIPVSNYFWIVNFVI